MCRLAAAALAAAAAASQAQTAAPASDGYRFADIQSLDCHKANLRLNEGVAAGSAEAPYTIAQMMARKVCFRRDPAVQAQFLRRAAEKGHAAAMRDLAYAHALGDGVPQDYAQAGTWLRQSGVSQAPEMDPYTLGYAWALGRQIRALSSATSFKDWRKHPHEVRVTLTLQPQALPPRYDVAWAATPDPAAQKRATAWSPGFGPRWTRRSLTRLASWPRRMPRSCPRAP